ncbi:MAG: glycoside hydrolase family 3 N-terminal domain-containing protein [Cyanobacteria bacterium J06626_18]
MELLWWVPLVFMGLLCLNLWRLWQRQQIENRLRYGMRLLLLLLCAAGLTFVFTTEGRYRLTKRTVLAGDRAQLQRLGQHLVVGYRDFAEVQKLVQKGGIGGVFITRHNLEGQSVEQLQQQIATLQALRREQNLPPLWVATDQEGGIVSRLSPPLTHLPPLAEVVSQAATPADQYQQVQQYGDTHGRELAAVGINLNFAPVVDLNKGVVTPGDRLSVIYRRAISDDNAVVAAVAQEYCAAMFRHGVRCTLKHFPGLGRLTGDTHLHSAHLDTPVAELAQDDWVPFQQVMQSSQAMTMLGHPILTAVDKQHPVSFSKGVVDGILRQQWQYDGLLITDDFSMGAVFNTRDGATGATIKALNAGVDLVLISYDADLYYPVMAALMQAEQHNRLSLEQLAASRDRLHRHPPITISIPLPPP